MSSALLPRDLVGVGVGVGAVWDYPQKASCDKEISPPLSTEF